MARSPNYPQLNLTEAIERVKQVYKAGHTHKADKEVVAKSLGYSSLNGASLAVIGTLKRYGLLQDEGDGLKVSDEAVAIIGLPKGDAERARAFRAAAFAPQLFAEMHETYGDHLPGDVHLRHFLIKKKFLPKAADEVIRVYRDNLELVADETEGYNIDDSISKKSEEKMPIQQPSETRNQFAPALPPSPEGQLHFPLYLLRGQKAALYAPASINKKEFELLKAQINNSLVVIEATSVVDEEALPFPGEDALPLEDEGAD